MGFPSVVFVFWTVLGLFFLIVMPLLLPWLLPSSIDVLGFSLLGVVASLGTKIEPVRDLFVDDTGVRGLDFADSSSLEIKLLIFPVVPILMDPPPPFDRF